MKRIIIWGTGCFCEKFLNEIKNFSNNQLNMVGYVDNDKKRQGLIYNENKIYSPNEILNLNFDYLIIASEFEDEIEEQILKLGIKGEKVIKGLANIFKYNFQECLEYYIEYKNIIDNKKFSIISDSCWGGFLYQKINKIYTSPFVWTRIYDNNSYIKLLKDLKYYLKQKPIFSIYKANIDNCYNGNVVGTIGDVMIVFPHFPTIEEAQQKWNKRLERFDYENIFVEMSITSENAAIEFDKLPFKNKVGFTYENYNLNSCIYIGDFINSIEDKDIKNFFVSYFTSIVNKYSSKYFDAISWIANS